MIREKVKLFKRVHFEKKEDQANQNAPANENAPATEGTV
jgi:hypothetical protein